MKKFKFLIILSLFTSTIFSQNKETLRKFISVPYQYEIETIDFKVLAINYEKQLVAFKHIFKQLTLYDEEGNAYLHPYNCKYAGMQKYPEAGVVLGVYDLSKQKYLKTFVIYNAASSQSECTDYKISKLMLDSAKQFFKKMNLDISQNPLAIPFKESDYTDKLDLGNFIFEAESSRSNVSEEMITISVLSAYNKTNYETKYFYKIKQIDYFEMASSSIINYIAAYKKGNKVVFLNRFHHINGMDQTQMDIYHFTPVFNLDKIFE